MPYCPNCRTFLADGQTVCPNCGTQNAKYSQTSTVVPPPTPAPSPELSFWQKIKKLFVTNDFTPEHDATDISQNVNFAIMAYLGPLFVIPLLAARKSKFTMFHFCQGLLNFVIALIYFFIYGTLASNLHPLLGFLIAFIGFPILLLFPVFSILGIINVIRKRAVTLPLHGRINLMPILFKNI